MKYTWALLVSSRFAIAAQAPFNVNEDLFAFPQYEVLWRDDRPVSLEDAAEKLRLRNAHSPSSSDTSVQSLSQHPTHESPDSPPLAEALIESYETMVLADQRYLCSIPTIPIAEPITPSNTTADEEANDMDMAVHRGQKLLKGMEGNCVYFISGWWSYSFCYNEGVRQFHPLPSGRNVPVYPPVEDKSVEAYVLGRFSGHEQNEDEDEDYDEESFNKKKVLKQQNEETGMAKLEVKGHKGSTRYLVQVLKGGTKCDLTGEARSIEVQFRCENLPTDRITVIKETSICQYRMVVSTPRLCNDAAFRPPVGPKPHPVACSPIMASEAIPSWIAARQSATAAYEASLKASAGQAAGHFLDELKSAFGIDTVDAKHEEAGKGMGSDVEHHDQIRHKIKKNLPRVGDIEVGGHNIMPEGITLEKGIVVGGTGNEKHIATIARSDGFTATEKQLSKLNIHGGKELELIKDKVRRSADGADWQIDVVETARGKELRGIIGDLKKRKNPHGKPAAAHKPKAKQDAEHKDPRDSEADKNDEGSAEGSEERYKEEL